MGGMPHRAASQDEDFLEAVSFLNGKIFNNFSDITIIQYGYFYIVRLGIRKNWLGVSAKMTYVVTENCIPGKYTDCAAVCPVDAFTRGPFFW